MTPSSSKPGGSTSEWCSGASTPTTGTPSRTPKQIARDVLRRVRPGSIVLLHDGGGDGADTIAALPRIIEGIRKMGLDLVTLDPYRRR